MCVFIGVLLLMRWNFDEEDVIIILLGILASPGLITKCGTWPVSWWPVGLSLAWCRINSVLPYLPGYVFTGL